MKIQNDLTDNNKHTSTSHLKDCSYTEHHDECIVKVCACVCDLVTTRLARHYTLCKDYSVKGKYYCK